MHKLSLQAITTKDRSSVIWDLKETIRDGGGWIINYQLFSNKAIGVHFEVYFESIRMLSNLLSKLDIGLQEDSQKQFAQFIELYESEPSIYQEKLITAFMNVTFEHNDPELIIPVPMVPG